MSQKQLVCPRCQNDDKNMLESVRPGFYYCLVCSKTFEVKDEAIREASSSGENTKRKV
jgi:transposase-like protein